MARRDAASLVQVKARAKSVEPADATLIERAVRVIEGAIRRAVAGRPALRQVLAQRLRQLEVNMGLAAHDRGAQPAASLLAQGEADRSE